MSLSRIVEILALAARLSEADAHRYELRVYVIEARAIVLSGEELPS